MASDYVALSGLVLLAALLVAANGWRQPSSPGRVWLWVVLAVVTVCTLVFDPVLVHLGLIDYAYEQTLNIRFFGAPVEDLAYAVVAAIIMPYIWERLQHER